MSHKFIKFAKHKSNESASSGIMVRSRTVGDSRLHLSHGITNVTKAAGTFIALMKKGFNSGRVLPDFSFPRRPLAASPLRAPRDPSQVRHPSMPIASAILLAAVAIPAFASSNTYAAPYALSISFVDSSSNEDISSPTMELNVSPSKNGTFSKSNTSTIGVGTTSATGYTLSIAASNSNGDKLVNSSDSDTDTNYIASITEGITEETFRALPSDGSESKYNNKWGYLPSMWDGDANNLFRPAPTTAGHVLNTTDEANTVTNNTASDVCKRYDCDKYDITVGARVDVLQKIGTYSNTYVVYATANGTPYTITYKDNTISMPADESSNATGSTVAISNQIPTKDGYTFLGWCSVAPLTINNTDTCSGTKYAAGGTWNITEGAETNNLVLYAMWSKNKSIDDLLYMQDFNTLSSADKTSVINLMETGKNYYLMDSRDREVYIIAKLKDGRVWMRDNLRLGSNSNATDLASSDTNIDANYTLPQGITSGLTGYVEAHINAAYKNSLTVSYGAGSGKVGVFYNYCAVSAGTYCHESDAGVDKSGTLVDTQHDICPAGWRIPTGGDDGEYRTLRNDYNVVATDIGSLQYNLSVPLSGHYYGSDYGNSGLYGFSWSATYYDASSMYDLIVSSNAVGVSDQHTRSNSLPVRCLVR